MVLTQKRNVAVSLLRHDAFGAELCILRTIMSSLRLRSLQISNTNISSHVPDPDMSYIRVCPPKLRTLKYLTKSVPSEVSDRNICYMRGVLPSLSLR